MPRKQTREEILTAFVEVHGNRYDYSALVYAGAGQRVTVTCRVHGAFQIAPGHHKRGVGCRKCHFGGTKTGLDQFIARSTTSHSDRYDYSLVEPDVGAGDAVRIRCVEHQQLFIQNAGAHMRGHTGCRACLSDMLSGPSDARGKQKSHINVRQAFVQRARAVHGDRYDYDSFEYTTAATKGKIVCAEHGAFWQSASNHLRGNRCPMCSIAAKFRGSLKTRCRELGVDYWRALKRRQAGMPIERVLADQLLQLDRVTTPITVLGETYPNLEAACRARQPAASTTTIERWLRSGVSTDVAFERIPNPGYAEGIIYVVEHRTSGLKYVGLTVQTLQRRWNYHIDQAVTGRIRSLDSLHAHIRRDGPESFSIREVDKGTTKKNLERKEREWIKRLGTLAPRGFNISAGGVSGGSNKKPVLVDGRHFSSVGEAVRHVARTRGISDVAAKKRLQLGRLDVQTPAKPGQSAVKTPAYKAWSHIVHGALNARSKDFIPGLSLHEPWRSSPQFVRDVGQPAATGMSFARLDKDQGYSPSNCRWLTKSEASKINALSMKANGKLTGRRAR